MSRPISRSTGAGELVPLGDDGLRALFEGATILETTGNGEPKVALTPANRIVKRISRKPCGGALDRTPRALRFASNCERLRALGIRVPEVEAVHSLGPGRNHVLVYRPVEGESLRRAAQDPRRRAALLRTFATTLASHHAAGFVFRGGHLANYIVCPDGELGLIDLHTVVFVGAPASAYRRARALRIIAKYDEDRAILAAEGGLERVFATYAEAAGLGRVRAGIVAALAKAAYPHLRTVWSAPASPALAAGSTP